VQNIIGEFAEPIFAVRPRALLHPLCLSPSCRLSFATRKEMGFDRYHRYTLARHSS
jgi:hypothetical protein